MDSWSYNNINIIVDYWVITITTNLRRLGDLLLDLDLDPDLDLDFDLDLDNDNDLDLDLEIRFE